MRALHCVRLTRTSLSVGKDANIFPVDCRLNESLYFVENILLGSSWRKDAVKVEGQTLFSISKIKTNWKLTGGHRFAHTY